MKIQEMFGFKPEAPKLDFDLHDDLVFFMNNDPEFYRKEYYPFLNKFKHHCAAGRTVTPKAFVQVVKKAYESYRNKFPLPELDEQLEMNELEEICEKLQTQENKNYDDEVKKKQEKKNETPRTF
jgi:hypothetical protein